MGMFDDIAKDVVNQKVTVRNGRAAERCEVEAVVTGITRTKTLKQGPLTAIDMVVVGSSGPEGVTGNRAGEVISKTYPTLQPWAIANLKKDLCLFSKVPFETLSDAEFKQIDELASKGAFTGLAVKLTPRSYIGKDGEEKHVHDFRLVPGKNDPKDIAKRAKTLSDGGEVTF